MPTELPLPLNESAIRAAAKRALNGVVQLRPTTVEEDLRLLMDRLGFKNDFTLVKILTAERDKPVWNMTIKKLSTEGQLMTVFNVLSDYAIMQDPFLRQTTSQKSI